MFKLISYIIIFLISLSFQPVYAGTANQADLEIRLFELINNARVNPLAVAASLGMNPDQVLADLPELHEVLTNGLPPLYYNMDLRESALLHTSDMLNRNYYGHVSPDNTTPESRIWASGYIPKVTGESLGVLGFINFIDPEEAVNRIFLNMFKDELNPDRTQRLNILGADLEELGIGFGTGPLNIGNVRYNSYIVTCDFGTGAVSDMELELLEMVNQARKKPLAVAAALGMDTKQILNDLPELHDILINGIPPLSFNGSLYLSAKAHGLDMLENDYYSEVSSDGRTVYERYAENGYNPFMAAESMRLISTTDFLDFEKGVKINFERLFIRELQPDCPQRNILNPDLKEAGCSIIALLPDVSKKIQEDMTYRDYYTLLMLIDFGTSLDDTNDYLHGLLYTDLNNDGLFDFREGIPSIAFTLKNIEQNDILFVFTNRAGSFSVPLESGRYQISARSKSSLLENSILMLNNNYGIDFLVYLE